MTYIIYKHNLSVDIGMSRIPTSSFREDIAYRS